MKQPILKRGAPVLARVAEEVTAENTPTNKLLELVRDLAHTMFHSHGVGVAAPQIGVSKRVFVYHVPDPKNLSDLFAPIAMINPVIVPVDPEDLVESVEGCLSIPGSAFFVKRYRKVRYRAASLTLQQLTEVSGEAEGFHAKILQHEMDHLDGILVCDKGTQLTPEQLKEYQERVD